MVHQLSMHIKPSQTKLLENQTDIRYSTDQIRHLRSFANHLKLTHGSPAIKLLHNLQSTPGIKFIYEAAYLTKANQITIRNYSGVDLVDLFLAGNSSGLTSTTTEGAPRKLSKKGNILQGRVECSQVAVPQSVVTLCSLGDRPASSLVIEVPRSHLN
jgi:hypothetical protein